MFASLKVVKIANCVANGVRDLVIAVGMTAIQQNST
jgi:hypothetical protein